jgi:hypothetical protein
VARSSEPLWLWLGGGLIGVGGVALGIAATLESVAKVSYSLWTSAPAVAAYVMFGLSLVCFVCAIREVAIPYPVSRRPAQPLVTSPPGTPPVSSPVLNAAPVRVHLVPERDITTDGFRLVALNWGEPGHFRAEVTSIRDQDGQPPATPAGGWPVPWLDDGTVTSRDILGGGGRRMDFAHFGLSRLREDLEGTQWLHHDHWTFPSLPATVRVGYPAARTWDEQDRHFFIVTVRVIRDDPPGHAETQFKIGSEGQEPYCRELTAGSAAGREPTASLAAVQEAAVTNLDRAAGLCGLRRGPRRGR